MKKTLFASCLAFLFLTSACFGITAPDQANIKNKSEFFATEFPTGTLPELVASASSVGKSLVIDRAVVCNATYTIPLTSELRFVQNGYLYGTGQLTIEGKINSGLFYIIKNPVTSFLNQDVYPEWLGAVSSAACGLASSANENIWPNSVKNAKTLYPSQFPALSAFDTVSPFASAATWDTVGIQRALWCARRVKLSPRIYNINYALFMFYPLFCDVQGSGNFKTRIIADIDVGTWCGVTYTYKTIFYVASISGEPIKFSDMALQQDAVVAGATPTACIDAVGVNGTMLENLWLTSTDYGVVFRASSNDLHVSNITAEYCFNSIFYILESNTIGIYDCNLWGPDAVGNAKAINLANSDNVQITSSRFVGDTNPFYGVYSDASSSCSVTGSFFTTQALAYCYADSQVNDNRFNSAFALDAVLKVGTGSTAIGNYLNITSEHGGIDIHGPCSNVNISHNNIYFVGSGTAADCFAINATNPSVDYTTGATASVFVGNVMWGSSRAVTNIATPGNVLEHNVQP